MRGALYLAENLQYHLWKGTCEEHCTLEQKKVTIKKINRDASIGAYFDTLPICRVGSIASVCIITSLNAPEVCTDWKRTLLHGDHSCVGLFSEAVFSFVFLFILFLFLLFSHLTMSLLPFFSNPVLCAVTRAKEKKKHNLCVCVCAHNVLDYARSGRAV